MKTLLSKIEWPNFLFITLSPFIALLGTIFVIWRNGIHPATLILVAVMMGLTGFGITAGYHRLFSHRSYEARKIIKLLYLLFGGAALQGSVREWCCAHRKHHRFVDQEKDPYNVRKGFWHAHMGWIMVKSDQSDESNIQDLKQDPLILFQDRFYMPLAILVSFGLPTAVAALWGDAWGGFFIAGFARVVVNHHFTWLINSSAHYFGTKTYSDKNSSRDNPFIAFFTYGEGYHNFHHSFEADYRNGIRPYDWDPTKWLIKGLSWLKLTYQLRQIPAQVILSSKLKMEQRIQQAS